MKLFFSILALLGLFGLIEGHSKAVFCYWGTWSFYRDGDNQFQVEDMDPFLCTHGVYGYSRLNMDTWTIVPRDPYLDLDAELDCDGFDVDVCGYGAYRKFVGLKNQNPNFKAILAIGGWTADSERFSALAADPAKRSTFIDSLIPFLNEFGFDGLELDWEWPGRRQEGMPGGTNPDDRDNLSILIEEMSSALRADGKMLTLLVTPLIYSMEEHYDLERLMPNLDFMVSMTYDFHGFWPGHEFTGHEAPLYYLDVEQENENHPGYEMNVFSTMEYLRSKSYIDMNKVLVGMPAYGRGFILDDADEDGLYCPASYAMDVDSSLRGGGVLGYSEILARMNDDPDDWITRETCQWTSYSTNGKDWIGYENPVSAGRKAMYVNHIGAGGISVASIENDDFKGLYSDVKYPLLRALEREFVSGEKFDPTASLGCQDGPVCDVMSSASQIQVSSFLALVVVYIVFQLL